MNYKFVEGVAKGLSFGVEPRQHRLRAESRLDQLESHVATNRFGLPRLVDRPHSPFADHLQQLKRPDLLAQLLMHGTNFVNFVGRYCWVAGGEHGLHAVVVTEQDEPQAVIGSYLHRYAYPSFYADHVKHDRVLQNGYSREFETAADDFALARLRETGYSAQDFAALMETIALQAGMKLEPENVKVGDGLA